MLGEGFVFCALECEPLVPRAAEAAGLPSADRSHPWCGEGGPNAYQLGYKHGAVSEAFVFSRTDMTQEKTADRFLQWRAFAQDELIVIAAPALSCDFIADLRHHRNGAPVHFLLVCHDPWFTPVAE